MKYPTITIPIVLFTGVVVAALAIFPNVALASAGPITLQTNLAAKPTSGPAEQGMTLNWRGVTVDNALDRLAESAGFVIRRKTSTNPNIIPGTVDIVSEKPLSKEEIVVLVDQVLAEHGLTVRQDKNTLFVETTEEAMADPGTPVVVAPKSARDIPEDAQFVTEIIPLHSLSASQVVKDLSTLLPQRATVNTSETGNAVIMTATQADIRRFAQIISALDSTGNGDFAVLFLNHADAKSTANELKELFNTQDGAPGANPFAALIGNRAGAARGANSGDRADAGRRASPHINAVSDDQNNAILVSAPADFMPGISNIVHQLDLAQDDDVEIRLFALHNADCSEIASELTSVFPDPNGQNNQNGNYRNFGVAQVSGRNADSGTGMSERMKKQVTVTAVPDPRTQSVLVVASRNTMRQIELLVKTMDANPAGHQSVFVFNPVHANVLDLLGPIQTLFQSNSSSSSTASEVNALSMRMQAGAQAQASGFVTSGSSGGIGLGNSGNGR